MGKLITNKECIADFPSPVGNYLWKLRLNREVIEDL